MKYLYFHVLGYVVFDNSLNVVEETLFSDIKEYLAKDKLEIKLHKKYPDLTPIPATKLTKVLDYFKDQKYFAQIYTYNVALTKRGIRASVGEDGLLIQTISNIAELDRSCNLLVKRLREWYGLYLPELSHKVESNEKFTELVMGKTKEELIKELKVNYSMGADIKDQDLLEIIQLANQISALYGLRNMHEEYLHQLMKVYCPNVMELAGVTIGAKLLELAKSLKNMALLPASTIQLLGAEKALFRHLKTGAKSPKYGVIINHPLIQTCKHEDKGKVARALADKLSLCARLDYFKGEFKAKEYKKELEERFVK